MAAWHQFHQLLHSHYERVKLRSSLVFSAADAIKKTDRNLLLFFNSNIDSVRVVIPSLFQNL